MYSFASDSILSSLTVLSPFFSFDALSFLVICRPPHHPTNFVYV